MQLLDDISIITISSSIDCLTLLLFLFELNQFLTCLSEVV